MCWKVLCWVGVHRWECKPDQRSGIYWLTYNRCKRECCPRYREWLLVNIDRIDSRR